MGGDAKASRLAASVDAHSQETHGEFRDMAPIAFFDRVATNLELNGPLSHDGSTGAIGHGDTRVAERSAITEIGFVVGETVGSTGINADSLRFGDVTSSSSPAIVEELGSNLLSLEDCHLATSAGVELD